MPFEIRQIVYASGILLPIYFSNSFLEKDKYDIPLRKHIEERNPFIRPDSKEKLEERLFYWLSNKKNRVAY